MTKQEEFERRVKKWKAIEMQLSQASQFLLDSDRANVESFPIEDYRIYLRENELKLAMEELESIAIEYGAKSGFWRRLQKAAINMNNQAKVELYERKFHEALRSDA